MVVLEFLQEHRRVEGQSIIQKLRFDAGLVGIRGLRSQRQGILRQHAEGRVERRPLVAARIRGIDHRGTGHVVLQSAAPADVLGRCLAGSGKGRLDAGHRDKRRRGTVKVEGDFVPYPAQATNGTQALRDLHIALAEQGEVLVHNPVVGDAPIDGLCGARHRGGIAAVDFSVAALEVERAEDVVEPVALWRCQADFLGVLAELQAADIVLLRKGRERYRQAILVLQLRVAPAAVGAD